MSPSTPLLLSAVATGTAAHTSIDLAFSTAMLAGSGVIVVTDGAFQTVIDRGTGQPVTRLAGATSTRIVAVADAVIEGNHVKLDVEGLLPGHAYSVLMDAGVLLGADSTAFAGVRSTAQLAFGTPAQADTEGPQLLSAVSDGSLLAQDGSIGLTLTFSEAVPVLAPDAFDAPGATLAGLASADGGLTWRAALLAPAGAVERPANVLTLDLAKVADAAGNPGRGSVALAGYEVDTRGPGARVTLDGALLAAGGGIHATIVFSEAVLALEAGALQAGNARIADLRTLDGGTTWQALLTGAPGASAAANVLAVDLGKVRDLAGNRGSGVALSAAYAVDTVAPAGVSIALDRTTLGAGGAIGVTFTFSEAVRNFSAAAIDAPHAAAGKLASADGGRTWTALLTPTGTGAWNGNLLSVDLRQLQDVHGNAGSGSFVAATAYAVDTEAPHSAGIVLDGALVAPNRAIGVLLRFDEAVSLTAAAIDAPGAAVANLRSADGGVSWTAILTPAAAGLEADGRLLVLDMGQVRDAAGNPGSGVVRATQAYAVDTLGPRAAIAIDGAELARGGSIAVTITLSEAVAALPADALRAQHAAIGGLHTVDGGLTWKAVLTGEDGVLSAANVVTLDLGRLRDLHGNAGSGSSASPAYRVDTLVQPYAEHHIDIIDEGAFPGDYLSNAPWQRYTGSLSAPLAPGQAVEVRVDGALVETQAEGTAWTAWSPPNRLLEDGAHTVSVRVTDAAGHASAAFSQPFTIDTRGPALTVSPDGAAIRPGDTLVFGFDDAVYVATGEGRAVFTFSDANGSTLYATSTDGDLAPGRKSLTLDTGPLQLAPGVDYTVELPYNLTDLAGNRVRNPTLHIHTAGSDTLPPSAIAIVAAAPAGVYGIGQVLAIRVDFSEAVRLHGTALPLLHLSNGGLALFDHLGEDGRSLVLHYTVGAGGESDSDDLQLASADGLWGSVSDLAGNLLDAAHIVDSALYNVDGGQHGIRIDAHGLPGAPLLAAGSDTGVAGDGVTANATPALAGSGAAAGAVVKLYDGELLVATTRSDGHGAWSIGAADWAAAGHALAEGPHALAVRQYDTASTATPASGVLLLTVDTTIAAATIALHADSARGDGLAAGARPTLTGTGEAGAWIEVFDGAGRIGTARAGADGSWTLVPAAGLAEGAHRLQVAQTDAAGNTSPAAASVPLLLRIDTRAPSAPARPALAAASDSGISDHDGITRDSTPTLGGSVGEAGGTIALYEGDILRGSAAVGADGRYAVTSGLLGDGTHALRVVHIDAAGNRSAASAALEVTIDTAAPKLLSTALARHGLQNWLDLAFDEQIVFADGAIALGGPGVPAGAAQYTADVLTNWTISKDAAGVPSVLELNVGGLLGLLHVQIAPGAVQDLAGNAAVLVGSPGVSLPQPGLGY